MSVAPDQMPGLAGMNQPADPNLQQFQQLEGQAADVEQAAATNTAQTAQAMQQMQPPQRQTGVLSQAPYLMALAALGGKAIGLHARVMLGGLNGMVKGMLMGNQQAYDDAIKTYTENRQKMLDTYDLQDRYYGELVQAYGTRADAKLKAWEAAEKLANNEFNQKLAIAGLNLDQQKLSFDRMDRNRKFVEEVRNHNLEDVHRKFQERVAQQNADTRKQALDQKLSSVSGPNGIKELDSMMRTTNTQASMLMKKSLTGYDGLTDEDKQQYNQLLREAAAINARKHELMQQGTQQSAAATGSPGEPQGNVVTPDQVKKFATDNGISPDAAKEILRKRGAKFQDDQQPSDRAGVIDRSVPDDLRG